MKMKFSVDMFYDGKCIFEKDKVYEVSQEKGWADRWLKRGGVVVNEPVFVEKVQEKKEDKKAANTKHKPKPVEVDEQAEVEL